MAHVVRRLLPAVILGWAAVAGGLIAQPGVASAYSTSTPFGIWEVPAADIAGLGSPRTNVIVKSFSPGMNVLKYLDAAAAQGQKVVAYFMDTVDYSAGTISPGKIPGWVEPVKDHPALFGYVSVKEPSWNGISLAEMRTLYDAYKAADADHPVVALLGDVPHFGTSANPWGPGVANILWVDWYPVTYSRGYIATASTHFPKVRAYVDKVTPGTKIWLMVQGHGYKVGDRRTPTSAELQRQVRDAFVYLKANGILFHTWNNARYDKDLKRNPALWSTARSIIAAVRNGTFNQASPSPVPTPASTPAATAKQTATPTATRTASPTVWPSKAPTKPPTDPPAATAALPTAAAATEGGNETAAPWPSPSGADPSAARPSQPAAPVPENEPAQAQAATAGASFNLPPGIGAVLLACALAFSALAVSRRIIRRPIRSRPPQPR